MPSDSVQSRFRDCCPGVAGGLTYTHSRVGPRPRRRPSPAAGAWRGAAAFECLRRGAHALARLPRRREERESGRAEADPEPTHEAARRLHENPPPPLPVALLRAPQWEPPLSLLCRFSCSSFSSSSFSSSSGPQSGRSAPFTVSAPRPRPPARPALQQAEALPRGLRRLTPGALGWGCRGRRGSPRAPRARGRGPAARRRRPARHLALAPAGEGSRRDAAAG